MRITEGLEHEMDIGHAGNSVLAKFFFAGFVLDLPLIRCAFGLAIVGGVVGAILQIRKRKEKDK